MINLCTICVRGGSKGVPNKNGRLIAGKPLLAHSIQQAKDTGLFRAIAVSSDSEELLNLALEHGANLAIRRPDELATDTAPKLPVIRHAMLSAEEMLGVRTDIHVDIDATSPLRIPADIAACVEMTAGEGVTNVITGTPARRSPYFNLVELDPSGAPILSKILPSGVSRRQDAPPAFDMNASIYAWKRDELLNMERLFGPGTRLHVMPEERSIDIDSELDFRIVRMLMES